MERLFEFCQFKAMTEPGAKYLIALRPPRKIRGRGYIVDRECTSLTELKAVAAKIHDDLERAIEEARRTLGG